MDQQNGNLLKYFMEQTNERLTNIEHSLEDLKKFRVEMLVSAKLVGAVFGGVSSLMVSLVVHYLLK